MESKIQVITPKEAQKMLEGNKRNRPVRREHVKRLAEDMKAGKWTFNGVPLIFNGSLLIDGQHRLEACILADKPFKTLVVRGVDADAFVTIDIGAKRTGADTLATKGEKNYSAMAAALVIIDLYYSGEMGERVSARRGANRVIADAVKKYVAIRPCVEHCVPLHTKIIPISIMTACHYIFSRIDHVAADDFIDRLATGTNVKKDSPMENLRKALIDNYTSARKHSRGYIMSIVVKAWNHERTGKNLKRLRGYTGESAEQFPTAI